MQAIILCGGKGTRLGKLTENCPKPLLSIGADRIVEQQIKLLKTIGITEIFINLHYQGDKIKGHLGDGSDFGVAITYEIENELSGTAGGVKLFERHVRDSAFLVMYGDIVTTENLARLVEFHKSKEALISFYVHQRKNSNSIFHLDEDGQVLDFLERPTPERKDAFITQHGIETFWVNSAIYCMEPEVFKIIPAKKEVDIPRDLFPLAKAEQRLYALPIEAPRIAVDSPEALEKATAMMQSTL